jgi:hypothetical protein
MTLHPEVQEKARIEIDSVCGTDKLPTFADRDKLPYINAVCKETLRFHAVTPSGERVSNVYPQDLTTYFYPRRPSSCGRGRHTRRLLHPKELFNYHEYMVRSKELLGSQPYII